MSRFVVLIALTSDLALLDSTFMLANGRIPTLPTSFARLSSPLNAITLVARSLAGPVITWSLSEKNRPGLVKSISIPNSADFNSKRSIVLHVLIGFGLPLVDCHFFAG